VNSQGYFYTDWAAMTATDWAGLVILLLVAVVLFAAYIITFKPGNRSKFEQHCDFVNKEDEMELDREVNHG
jgi:cell division protein FtsL